MSNVVIEQLQAARKAMQCELDGMESRRKTLEISIADTDKLLLRLTKSAGTTLALAAPTPSRPERAKIVSPARNELGVDEWAKHVVAIFTEERRPLTAYDLDRLLRLRGIELQGKDHSFERVRGRLLIRPNMFERHGNDPQQGHATYWLKGVAVPAPDSREPLKASHAKTPFRKLTEVQEQYRSTN